MTGATGGGRFGSFGTPLAIAAGAALVEAFGDPGRLALRYERAGLADGELWRLLTGHLVHLGPSHLAMNLLALAILALVLPSLAKTVDWIVTALAAALAIDLGLYALQPTVDWYVGLSGVLHGFWAAGVALAFGDRRLDAIPLAILLALKLGYEAAFGPVPLSGDVAAGPVVAEAHAFGAVGGILAALALLAVRRRRRWL